MNKNTYYPKQIEHVPFYILEKKELEVNPVYPQATPYILTIDESSGASYVLLGADSSQRISMSNDDSGVVIANTLLTTATSRDFTCYFFDTRRQQYLSNRAIHSETILGIEGRGFELPYPIIIDRRSDLLVTLADLSGAGNTVRLFFNGTKHYSNEIRKAIDSLSFVNDKCMPYFYTTDSAVTMLASTSATGYITMNSDFDFYVHRITSKSTGVYKLKISDSRTNRPWGNGVYHSSCIGNAEYNYDFKMPQKLPRNCQLKLDFTDLSTALNSVYITLTGVAVLKN